MSRYLSTPRTEPTYSEERFQYGAHAEEYAEGLLEGAGLAPLRVEMPLFQYIALASVAFGVENRYEIFLAGASHVAYKFAGNDGLAAIYSVLAGIQIQKKRYKTAAMATLLDVYDTLQDFMKGRRWQGKLYTGKSGGVPITKKGLFKLGAWAAGYLAAQLRYV